MALTVPSDQRVAVLRWVTCFAVVLLLHAFAIARLLEQSEPADTPPGSDAVQLDVAIGELQQQIDPTLATPPQIVEQKPQQLSEPERKDAEVTLPKPDEQAEQTNPAPTPPVEAKEARAPPAVAPELVRKWHITVNTRLNQFKRYPPQARARHDEGIAIVEFQLGADGRVLASRIVRSSGSPILDEETLNLLTRAQPFPVPDGARSQDLFLQVPISYGLR
jgi:protein TonB